MKHSILFSPVYVLFLVVFLVACDNNRGDSGTDNSRYYEKDNSGDSGTDNSGDSGTDNSGDSGTDNSGDSGTDNSGDSGGDNGGDSGTDNSGDSGTDNSGDSGTDNSGDSGTDNSGDSGTDNSGDSGTDNSGDSGTDNSGDSGTDNSGDSGTDNSGDSGTDNSGDSGGDNSGDSGTDNSGDSGGDNSGDSGTDNSGDSGGDNGGDSGTDNSGDSGGDNGGGSGTPATTLAVVTNVQATAADKQVTLSWDTADGVDSYNIYYAEQSFAGDITKYMELKGGTLKSAITTSETINDLTNDTEYYFVVTTVKDGREGKASAEVSVTTPLSVVTNVQATAADKQVTLSWDTADGVDSYNIYYAEQSFAGDITKYMELKGGTLKSAITTSETINDLTNDTEYYFVVTTVKDGREGKASAEVSVTTPLSVVTNVQATAADKQVTLSWDTADGVDSYNIYYAEQSFAGDITKYMELKGGTLKSAITTSETINDLTNDTEYYFVVTTVKGGREGKASAEVSVTTPLSVVTNVQATAADKQVTLSWDTADGVDSYNIYYAEQSFAGDITKYMELKGGTLKSAITTSETINDLTNDTEYYFVVTTVKGGREGKASAEVSVTTPLSVVTNVQATAADKQVTLSWDTADGVDSYNIYYAEQSFAGDITKYMELKGGTLKSAITTSETINDLTNDTEYYFVVTTVKDGREGKASAEVSVTTPLSVVTNVQATAADKQVTLSWDTADGVDSYNIYYAEQSFAGDITKYMELKGGTLESDISKTKTSETITDLTNDTNYYFVVTTVKGGREGKASAEVSVTTPLSVVTNVQATAADKQVTLSWDTADGVDSYNIYYAEQSFAGDITKYMELKGGTLKSAITTSETINDLTNDTEYYFVVTTVKGGREGKASAEVSVTTPLSVVTNVQATAADKQVTLSWDTADGVDSYNIYYAEQSFAGDITKYMELKGGTLKSAITTSETINDLTNDTEYYFVVTTVKDGREGKASAEVSVTTPLSVVTNVQATAADKQVTLSWDTADGVDSYNIYYAEQSFAGDITKYMELKGGTLKSAITTSETINDLTNDTEYYFVVTTVKGGREGKASAEVSVTTPLSVVTNVQATAADKQVTLSWDTADGVDSYNIYYAEQSFAGDITKYMELKGGTLKSAITTSETINDLTNDTEYYFVVTTVKGGREGKASAEVSVTTPLSVVTNVQATAADKQVTLSWDTADGVDSYNIYYAEQSFAGDITKYMELKGGTLKSAITTSETINDLTNDTEYYFVVTTVKGGREGKASAEVSVTTPLSVVTNVQATAADKQVTLSWDTADGVDSYNIYYAEQSFAGDITKYMELKGGTLKSAITTSETINDLTNDTEYYFVVTTVKGGREGKASAEVSVTTPLSVVTNVQATAADKQVTLSWDTADGVDSYNIYYAEQSFAGDITKYMELKGGTLKSAITTSETINDLTNDTEYYFVVTTVKDGREGKASAEVSVTTPLSVVTNVQATAADKQVTLSWDTADGVDSYNIYYAEQSFAGDITKYMELKGGTLKSAITTSETINDLTNDTEYYFVVTTVKGGREGKASAEVSVTTPLSVVTNVQATAADKQVTLSWDTADGVDSYNIYYAEQSFAGDITKYMELKGGTLKSAITTSETINDLTNDTEYYFVVTTVKGGREGKASAEVSVTTPLSVVTNVQATAADKQVTLSWDTADGVDSYNIYYAEQSFAGDITKYMELKGGTLKSAITTSETINDLTNDTEYYFVVTTVKGGREGKASAEVSVTTPLSVVTNVQATAADKQVTLSWDTADGVDSYNIYYAEQSFAGDITKYMELKGGTLKSAITTSETINDLTNDTEYYFVVTTVKDGREGKASDEVLARPLAVVTNVQATAADKQVTLSWDTADGVDSYNIYYAEQSFAGDITKYMELKGGTLKSAITTSETINDLTNDTEYYFVVTTVKGGREGKASAEVSVTTPLSVVTNVQATAADKQVTLSWDTADGVDSYNIYYAEQSFAGDITKYMELKGGTLKSAITTSETINDLTNDTEYYFVVTTVKDGREGKASAEVSVTTPLSVVTNVQATAADKQVTLSWDTADGVDSYNIYYAEQSFAGDIDNYILLNGSNRKSNITNTPETIEDLTNYTKYYFVVTSVKGSRESEASAEVSVATPPHPQRLNDTGMTWGGSYPVENNLTSCTSNGTIDASQDCHQGRDAQALAGTLVKTGSGEAGFDFTKLDATGDALAIQNRDWSTDSLGTESSGTKWSCVRDNVTGLTWEIKNTESGDNIHHKDNLYKWGGVTAIGRGHLDEEGTYHDDWNTLVNGSNSEALCGYNDWRAPTPNELLSITNLGRKTTPAIDTHYFPNTEDADFWSASSYASNSNNAWYVAFDYGKNSNQARDTSYRLRLVRGGEPVHNRPYVSASSSGTQRVKKYIVNEWPDERYTVHDNGTVTDKVTTLIWKQCPEGSSGSECDSGSEIRLTWKKALEQAKEVNDGGGFAGSTDWRLPNRNELLSLSALDRYKPAINITVFPGTPPNDKFWSASPYVNDSSYAWNVNFNYGLDYGNYRSNTYRLRLVRGGQ